MTYLLGIDQGTTQTTAVIVNERGEMIEKNSAQLPARFPQPGWVEQDPRDILRTVKEACAPRSRIRQPGRDFHRLGRGHGRASHARHRLAGHARTIRVRRARLTRGH